MKSYASLQRIFTISGADVCVKQNMGEIANHFLRQKYHFEVPCGWCIPKTLRCFGDMRSAMIWFTGNM